MVDSCHLAFFPLSGKMHQADELQEDDTIEVA
jgi:hypothetical protein